MPEGGPAVPARIGRYEVVREVGRGTMGVVYEAHDPALGRTIGILFETARRVPARVFLRRPPLVPLSREVETAWEAMTSTESLAATAGE